MWKSLLLEMLFTEDVKMLYTVGETAKILNIAPSTLRYYDKEGLLPFVERSGGGMRVFKQEDFNWLFIIECLKKSGLSIKEIKKYIDMALKGDETIEERLEMFQKQKEKVINQMKELQNTLDTIEYKCWFYETARELGSVKAVANISYEEIPQNLRAVKENIERMHQKQ